MELFHDENSTVIREIEEALISRSKPNGDRTSYSKLVASLRTIRSNDQLLVTLYTALAHCASAVSPQCTELLSVVSQFDWAGQSASVCSAFSEFITSLVSANKHFLKPMIHELVSRFHPPTVSRPSASDDSVVEYVSDVQAGTIVSDRVHPVLSRILQFVPQASALLSSELKTQFPHRTKGADVQNVYVRACLQVAAYAPVLLDPIVELCIVRLIELDSEIPSNLCKLNALRSFVEESCAHLDEEDDDDAGNHLAADVVGPGANARASQPSHDRGGVSNLDNDLQFEFDGQETAASQAGPAQLNETETKLDLLLSVMFEFVQAGLRSGDRSIVESLHDSLLSCLFGHVLPVEGLTHVPYLWLFAAHHSPDFCSTLVESLLDHVGREAHSLIQQQRVNRSPHKTHRQQKDRSRAIVERCATFAVALACRLARLPPSDALHIFSSLADTAQHMVQQHEQQLQVQQHQHQLLYQTQQQSQQQHPLGAASSSSSFQFHGYASGSGLSAYGTLEQQYHQQNRDFSYASDYASYGSAHTSNHPLATDPTYCVLVQSVCCGFALPQIQERLLSRLGQSGMTATNGDGSGGEAVMGPPISSADLYYKLHLDLLLRGPPIVHPSIASCVVESAPADQESVALALERQSKWPSSSVVQLPAVGALGCGPGHGQASVVAATQSISSASKHFFFCDYRLPLSVQYTTPCLLSPRGRVPNPHQQLNQRHHQHQQHQHNQQNQHSNGKSASEFEDAEHTDDERSSSTMYSRTPETYGSFHSGGAGGGSGSAFGPGSVGAVGSYGQSFLFTNPMTALGHNSKAQSEILSTSIEFN